MPGRVIVLGAGGFLGRQVSEAFLTAGWDVVAATHVKPCPWVGLETLTFDVTNRVALLRAVQGADCVIDASATKPSGIVRTAANLAAVLREDAVGRVVQVSSLSIFGQNEGVLSEATPPKPAAGHTYGRAKIKAERILASDEDRAARVLIVRPGCIYGPAAPIWVDRLSRMVRAGRLGSLGSEGGGTCTLIHAADVAYAILHGVQRHAAGIHHLVSPEHMTWNAYFQRLGRLMGVPVRNIHGLELAASTWLLAPVRRTAAQFSGGNADIVTPAMRRLFRNPASHVSVRAPLLASPAFHTYGDGIDEAVQAFMRRCNLPLHRQRPLGQTRAA